MARKKAKKSSKKQTAPLENHVEKQVKKHLPKHITRHLSDHLISKKEFIRNQFKQHASTAIIAAFSFLIALTWKDFIVHIVSTLARPITLEKYPYLADLYSAIIVTIIAIAGIAIVTRWAKKPEVLVSETRTK